MKPGRYNFAFVQGDTWTAAPQWKINDAYVNVSGYTAKLTVRKAATSSTSVFEFSTDNGRITVGSYDGKFTLTAVPADTASVAAGNYIYDFDVVSSGGVSTTLLSGGFQVIKQVSA
jgi:hypothetical protein